MKPSSKSLGWLAAGLAFGLSSAPSLSQAKIDFSAYEGPPVIRTGEGGTRVQRNGIDYWTSGTPPRRYQVIGMISDKRDEQMDGGHAIGSPNIAGKVKRAGGDAVIVQNQEEAGKSAGGGFFGNGYGFMGMGGSKTITTMLVVKYLPDIPADAAPSPTASPSANPAANAPSP